MKTIEIGPRVKFNCRRGILELELFLTRLIQEQYQNFSETEKNLFSRMLELSDVVLFDWFLNKQLPEKTDPFYLFVKKIQLFTFEKE